MLEKNWSIEEVNKLKRMYPYVTNEDLSIIFNRSISSIQHKANRLKLHKDKEVLGAIRSRTTSGEKCPSWKGGVKTNKKGYKLILKKGHPLADKNGYILEHRYIMCEHLGRILGKDEIVHHKNGIKNDNRIENLEIMTNSEHTISHHKGSKRSKESRKRMSEARKRRYRNE